MVDVVFKANDYTTIPHFGAADESVAKIRAKYNVIADEHDLRAWLKEYGAWEDNELANHSANIDRLVWLATWDCRENHETEFYFGS